MEIIPAIDIREGACERIFGEAEPATVYTDDPLEQAIIFKQLGAKSIHITDVDGSFCGHLCTMPVISEMVDYSGVKIQFSGGIRTIEDIDKLIELGVDEIVPGVHIFRDPELAKAAVAKCGARLVPAVDGRDGMVAIEGFETSVSKTVPDFLAEIKALGIEKIIYTDLHRYGTMQDPDFDYLQKVLDSGLKVIYAGGVSCYDNIKKLKDMGVEAVIIGKALYYGVIRLDKAIEIAD